MGRGRARAKQAKVARELKYSTPATDFKALERELSGQQSDSPGYEFEYDRESREAPDTRDVSERDYLVD
ncbi:DUF3073 domain-containing protein [Streptomyces sp. AJS327]|uniref:DUF3073 domain-containing protein n=1 Tax=Streptomyces sp. AJS327 TaxID=2545265 RepID=UPI0015E00225|nr:DUF3073 domain-containing protein [Streptomyces sp. AJS327]MBA0050617.1 DUF3073 domain-containing protein [Streptomyces sp. AJS327]